MGIQSSVNQIIGSTAGAVTSAVGKPDEKMRRNELLTKTQLQNQKLRLSIQRMQQANKSIKDRQNLLKEQRKQVDERITIGGEEISPNSPIYAQIQQKLKGE